jgi:hypothetical protein
LDSPLPPNGNGFEEDVVAVAVPEPLPAVELAMPYTPPPSAMVAAPIAMNLVSLRENMN